MKYSIRLKYSNLIQHQTPLINMNLDRNNESGHDSWHQVISILFQLPLQYLLYLKKQIMFRFIALGCITFRSSLFLWDEKSTSESCALKKIKNKKKRTSKGKFLLGYNHVLQSYKVPHNSCHLLSLPICSIPHLAFSQNHPPTPTKPPQKITTKAKWI